MARLAGLLEAVGIQTWEHDEGEKVRLGDSPFVSFFGDDETERAALKVAWGAGYYPHLSERERHLIGEQMEEPVSYTLWFDRDFECEGVADDAGRSNS